MQLGKGKLLSAILLFVGIIGLGTMVYNLIRLYSTMPSREDVMELVSGAQEEVSAVADTVAGSLVPDGGQAQGGTDAAMTTFPADTGTAPASGDWLTPGQRQVLKTLGIDESALPATLTPELEACFVTKIGADRVNAIKTGDTPSLVEGMKAMACL